MTTPTLANIGQLQARIPGGFPSGELSRALAALEDASAWIRAEAGIDWLDTNGDLDLVPSVIVSICCAVARRIYDNPDGILQESIAQYSYSRTNATTSVYLTKQERLMIRKAAGTNSVDVITLESPYTYPRVVYGGGYEQYDDWYVAQ